MIEVEEKVVTVVDIPTVTMDWPNDRTLNQNTTKMEFVLVDNDYKTLHKPFYCKDYFNEIFATEIDSKVREQYGFRSEKLPVDILKQDIIKLALICKKDNIFDAKFDYINKMLDLLNKADLNRGYIPTTVELTTDPNVVVLNIDTRWASKPAYFSFYTMNIRMSFNWTIGGDYNSFIVTDFKKTNSQNRINSSEYYCYDATEDFINYIFEGGLILQEWKEYLSENNDVLHNESGVNSYFGDKYGRNLNNLIEDVKNNSVAKEEV